MKIRNASLAEMSFLLTLAEKEGWNPGLHDALPFFSADPKGFFIGESEGEKVGCISAVNYNDSYGFLGLYVMRPEFRHQGWGLKLWNRALQHLDSRCIGLDGVVAQQENYKRSGFKHFCNNRRMEGTGKKGKVSNQLVPLQKVPLKDVVHYDASIFGCERKKFLEKWITLPDSYGFALIQGQDFLGYGVIRACKKGWKIGPLFADTNEVAELIFNGLIGSIGAVPYYLDIPQNNSQAISLTEKYALKTVFETARMYTKKPPRQEINKVFGVTTFELG